MPAASPPSRIRRVLVVCAEPIVGRGVASIIADAPDLDPSLGDLGDLLTADAPYDLVIYDTLALIADRTELRTAIGRSDIRVLALTRDLRPGLTRTAVGVGIHGKVSVHASASTLLAAIRRTMSMPLTQTLRANDIVDPELEKLTERERQVLELIAAGHSNQHIAETLFVTVNSVKTYIRGAYRRVDITSRSQAVIWAIHHGIGPASRHDEAVRVRPLAGIPHS